jgi:hypothetical protein
VGRRGSRRPGEMGTPQVVQRSLDTWNVDSDRKDNNDRTPLSWAASNGHERRLTRTSVPALSVRRQTLKQKTKKGSDTSLLEFSTISASYPIV